MARLPKGMDPTPAKERLKKYRAELESSGGKRATFDLSPEAHVALKAILKRPEVKTATEAVATALINEARRGSSRA